MKINKYVLSGLILMVFGLLLFVTDVFTPFIRPITYLFLMGSSKGKDILFFTLFGFFLIVSQLPFKINKNKSLLITIASSSLILLIAIILEIYLRISLGIDLNTIFVTVRPSFSTTSILHTHLVKSVLGQFLVSTINPLIGSGINTASSLYSYISPFTIPIAILFAILFVSSILSLQKRTPITNVSLAFFLTILIIGCFDGGIFGTPAALGLFGCVLIYWRENHPLFTNKTKSFAKSCIEQLKHNIEHPNFEIKFILDKAFPYFVGLLIIFLRLSISIVGANPEYYEVDIYNPDDGLNLTDEYPVEYIAIGENKITYHMNSSLNEMNLTNELSESLNNSCDYYTVSWNVYSYL